jgi:CRP-like cAMP-binding protein
MPLAISSPSNIGNSLIDALEIKDRNLLLAATKPVFLDAELTIYEHEDAVRAVYFPLKAVFSSCSLMEDGSSAEVCLTGKEGIVGVSAVFGEQNARLWTNVLVAGQALKMEKAALRQIVSTNENLRKSFLGFYRELMMQVSRRAVCNGRHTLLQRFCFWLLLVHDRTATDEIPLTHEMIARKLGARRAGVTNVAGVLQEAGAIIYSRGMIHIAERQILESEVCECYRSIKEQN